MAASSCISRAAASMSSGHSRPMAFSTSGRFSRISPIGPRLRSSILATVALAHGRARRSSTVPPRTTCVIFPRSPMRAVGSPATSTRSARLPTAISPKSALSPARKRAFSQVAARNASPGVRPASTSFASSRWSPAPGKSPALQASLPARTGTPAARSFATFRRRASWAAAAARWKAAVAPSGGGGGASRAAMTAGCATSRSIGRKSGAPVRGARAPRLVGGGDLPRRARQDVPAKVPGEPGAEDLRGVTAGCGEDRPRGVEMGSEARTRRQALALPEDGGAQAPEVEDCGNTRIKEGGEVLADVGQQRNLPRRVRRGAGVRVDVDQPREQRPAPAADLGEAGAGEARRPDGGDPAGAPDAPDDLPLRHLLADFHVELLQVAVARAHAVAVIERDVLPEATLGARLDDRPRRRRLDRRPRRAADVDPLVDLARPVPR